MLRAAGAVTRVLVGVVLSARAVRVRRVSARRLVVTVSVLSHDVPVRLSVKAPGPCYCICLNGARVGQILGAGVAGRGAAAAGPR